MFPKINVIEKKQEFFISNYRKNMFLNTFIAKTQKQKNIISQIKKDINGSYVFLGNPGTGKSHIATAIIREHWNAGNTDLSIVKFRKICADVRADFSKEYGVIKPLVNVSVLVIEEIGRGYNSDFESGVLFEIIDGRIENNMQTIITSNMKKNDFIDFVNDATIDRLREKFTFVYFDWESMRKTKTIGGNNEKL